MKKIFLVLLLLSGSVYSMSQIQDSVWVYTYGGSQEDYARKIITTADSGYIIVGTTSSYGAGMSDVYVIKTDSQAVRQWSHAYGSPSIEWGYAIRQTADLGYIVAGYSNQNSASGYDIYLLRLDETGNILWEKTIGGSDWDFGYDIEICSDGGFLITGKTYSYTNGGSDLYLVKTDSAGNVIWEKHYGGAEDESGNGIIRNRNGNFGIAGETKSYGAGDNDAWILQVNEAGDTLWTRSFGTTAFDACYGIDTSLDGKYHLVGTSYISFQDSSTQIYFFKLDAAGNQEWEFFYGGSEAEEGWVVKTLPDGEIICGGMTLSYGNGKKAYFALRNNGAGYFTDGSSYGEGQDEEGFGIAIGHKSEIVFAGITDSRGCGLNDIYLVRVDTFVIHQNSLSPVFYQMCDSAIGINETELRTDPVFFASPNPSNSQVQVFFSGSMNAKNYELVLSEATGKRTGKYAVRRFPYDLNVDGNPGPGIYMLSLYEEGIRLSTVKLVRY